jgi:hypothetical protein
VIEAPKRTGSELAAWIGRTIGEYPCHEGEGWLSQFRDPVSAARVYCTAPRVDWLMWFCQGAVSPAQGVYAVPEARARLVHAAAEVLRVMLPADDAALRFCDLAMRWSGDQDTPAIARALNDWNNAAVIKLYNFIAFDSGLFLFGERVEHRRGSVDLARIWRRHLPWPTVARWILGRGLSL